MNVVRDDVTELVERELRAANMKYPQFHSPHEGYAVMLEEYEEAKNELIGNVEILLDSLWNEIRMDTGDYRDVDAIMKAAINAACEVIQTAAMARKFTDGVRSGWNVSGK